MDLRNEDIVEKLQQTDFPFLCTINNIEHYHDPIDIKQKEYGKYLTSKEITLAITFDDGKELKFLQMCE